MPHSWRMPSSEDYRDRGKEAMACLVAQRREAHIRQQGKGKGKGPGPGWREWSSTGWISLIDSKD